MRYFILLITFFSLTIFGLEPSSKDHLSNAKVLSKEKSITKAAFPYEEQIPWVAHGNVFESWILLTNPNRYDKAYVSLTARQDSYVDGNVYMVDVTIPRGATLIYSLRDLFPQLPSGNIGARIRSYSNQLHHLKLELYNGTLSPSQLASREASEAGPTAFVNGQIFTEDGTIYALSVWPDAPDNELIDLYFAVVAEGGDGYQYVYEIWQDSVYGNHPVAFLMDDLHTGYTDFTQDVTIYVWADPGYAVNVSSFRFNGALQPAQNHAHVPRLSDSGMNDLIVDTLISDFNNNIGTYKSTKIIPYPKRIDGSVSALENQKSTKPKITLPEPKKKYGITKKD